MRPKKKNFSSLIGLAVVLILGPMAYFRFIKPRSDSTKKSAYADLVHLTDLLIDWPDNLSSRVPNNIDNVKRQSKTKFGVDSPGVALPANKSPHEPSTNSSEKANGKIWREPEYSSKSTFANSFGGHSACRARAIFIISKRNLVYNGLNKKVLKFKH